MARDLGTHIVADPRILHGQPSFRGTRIPVADVLYQVAKGTPWDEIMREWEGKVSHDAIAEAVALARSSFLEREGAARTSA